MKNFLTFGFCFLILSCSSSPKLSIPPNAEVTFSSDGDHRVGSYVSSWHGFRTSSYWIEGPTGLILIDTQFLLSASEEMVNWAEQSTGKKAVLAIVLHPNPDKFNGTEIYQKRGIKVVTSEQVLKLIPAVHQLRTSWFYERYKPDYPVHEPKPKSFGSETREIQAAGLKVTLHVLGPGCSGAHVVVQFENHVFVGDLITQGFHSWLELGMLKEWIERLQEIRALNPHFVHTGRGGSGNTDLIDREEDYLNAVIKVVKKYQNKKIKFSDQVSEKTLSDIKALYPSYEYPTFAENGLEEVWKH